MKAGHQARYRRSCAGLVGAAAQGPIYPREMGLLLRVCVLGPDAVADYQPLFSLIDRLRKVAKSIKGQQRLVLALQGALLYRVGRHGEAVARLKESVGEGQPAGRMEAAFLAMAYHKLGQAAEARRWLDSALAAGPRDEATLDWDTLEGWLLCREAGALLGAKSPK